jgi:hypothetical protein
VRGGLRLPRRRCSCGWRFLRRWSARQELFVKGGNAAGLRLPCGLFLAQHEHQFSELQIEGGDGAVSVAEAGVEFAFTQGEDMGADLDGLLLISGVAFFGFELESGASAAFVERLHPEGFGNVCNGFGEAVQGGWSGVEAAAESLPPGVQEGVDGVGGAGAECLADSVNGGAFT